MSFHAKLSVYTTSGLRESQENENAFIAKRFN